jgi:hypothetical protein
VWVQAIKLLDIHPPLSFHSPVFHLDAAALAVNFADVVS